MSNAWIETSTGKRFDILEPDPDSIDIVDIAHALSMLCRFTGHVKTFYSVAQHSYLGSIIIEAMSDRLTALQFLLHDASEAYLGDMNRPMKHHTEAGKVYREVEEKVQSAIYKKFGLPVEEHKLIHDVDNSMLLAEKEQLMTSLVWGDLWKYRVPSATVKIYEIIPSRMELLYLDRFKELTKGDI